MQFKSEGLIDEFNRAEPAAIAMALYFDWYSVRFMGGLQAVVTDVDRSQAEYDAIYATDIAKGKFWLDKAGVKHYNGPMPHLYDGLRNMRSRAVDFRSSIYTVPEIEQAVAHFNANFRRPDMKPSMLYHDVGDGAHIHVQAFIPHKED